MTPIGRSLSTSPTFDGRMIAPNGHERCGASFDAVLLQSQTPAATKIARAAATIARRRLFGGPLLDPQRRSNRSPRRPNPARRVERP